MKADAYQPDGSHSYRLANANGVFVAQGLPRARTLGQKGDAVPRPVALNFCLKTFLARSR